MPRNIEAAQSTNELTLMLAAYCEANDLPYESADEVLLEALGRIAEAKTHADWLIMFIAVWNVVQAREDAAACRRNGHRDSGRGQCVDCDEFI